MKTNIYLILLLMAIVLFGCKKDKDEDPGAQDVIFKAIQIDPSGGLKSTTDWDVECSELEPTHAHVVINAVAYDPEVYRQGGQLYSQAIKFAPGTYTVSQFFTYKESGDAPGYDSQDLIIMATPVANATFSEYTDPDVPFTFTVEAFKKTEVPVQVLCFQPSVYTNFGFAWFEITEIVIREVCFFGDICVDPTDYIGSAYAGQDNGLQQDMPAIFEIRAYKGSVAPANELPGSPFSNLSFYPAGSPDNNAPLCVNYPDNLSVDGEVFLFELWVLVAAIPSGFDYQLYATYTSTDASPVSGLGLEGIVDFAIGTCSPNSTNIYEWLPAPTLPPDFFAFKIRNTNGTITSPWDETLQITENIPEGDGFSCYTPLTGQKVGYGTNLFNGMKIKDIQSVDWDWVSTPLGINPYLNIWVTDGLGHYAIISSENVYMGTDFWTRQEWKVFEFYDSDPGAGINLSWLFDSGLGSRDGAQYLTLGGTRVTLNQLGNNIVLADPGAPYPSYVGTGAPRAGSAFNLIWGDTQANFIIGPVAIENLSITISGVTYYAQNP